MFGIRCRFTTVVLRTLLANDAHVAALVLPGPPTLATPLHVPQRRLLPMQGVTVQPGVEDIAQAHGIVVTHVGDLRAADTRAALRACAPDPLAVACYPRRIPASVRDLAPLGAFNIHPSLLPDKRGPDPLFWIFRNGDDGAGVTVHMLANRFDAGAIAEQACLPLVDGTTEAQLETAAAKRGAELLLTTLRAAEADALTVRPQADELATWAPWPTTKDYMLDRSRPARLAYNFVRGVAARGEPIMVDYRGARACVVETLAFGDDHTVAPDGAVAIPFTPGMLIARLTAPPA